MLRNLYLLQEKLKPSLDVPPKLQTSPKWEV